MHLVSLYERECDRKFTEFIKQMKVVKRKGIVQIYLSVKKGNIFSIDSFYAASFTFVGDNYLS